MGGMSFLYRIILIGGIYMKKKNLEALVLALLLSVTATLPMVYSINETEVLAASEELRAGVDDIKSIQIVLNTFGYNCGSADGIMGQQTIDAIKNFQRDEGLQVTGQINSELLDYLLAGIPLNMFSNRYNESIVYINKLMDISLKVCDFDEDVEEYCPNNNLTLSINPNLVSRRMVGNINIYSNSKFDTDLTIGEIASALYALDVSLKSPNDALTLLNNVFDSDGTYTSDGITFKNYSIKGMVVIKAEYDTFSSSSISKNFRSDSDKDDIVNDDNSTNSEDKYSHKHYDIGEIESENITDALTAKNNSDIERILNYIGQSKSNVESDIGVNLDKNHMSESDDNREWYKIKGSIGEYIGYYSMTLDKKTNTISYISFDFGDDDKPLEVDSVVKAMTSILGKKPDKFHEPSTISGNYIWYVDNYYIEIIYYNMDDSKYPGTQFISFNKVS